MKAVLSRASYTKFNLVQGLLSLANIEDAKNLKIFAHGLYGLYNLDKNLMRNRDLTLAASDINEWGILTSPSEVSDKQWDEYLQSLKPHQRKFVESIMENM